MRLHAAFALWLAFVPGLLGVMNSAADESGHVLVAVNFGLAADGTTDDGPAIAALLEAAREHEEPVTLRFPENATIYLRTGEDRYVFLLDGMQNLTLDGGGCLFILDPHVRFMSLTRSRNIRVRNLNVDFSPLPFADGTITGVDAENRFVDVRLRPGQAPLPPGGPTGEDGEQAFFSMLWREGPYGRISEHYWTERIEPLEDSDTVRVYCTDGFDGFGRIQPMKTLISIPVPGIAHRFGPGPCFRVHDNHDVTFEDIELWSAPWFGFDVLRNTGTVRFQRVHLRPRPDSDRLMSLWRDGFHVKGNAASLRWDDCVVSGMNDDAFNISTHSSVVREVLAPNRIVVSPKFPLGYIPWRVGAALSAADETTGRLLPSRRVVDVAAGPAREIAGKPAAPERITLTLDSPAPDLRPGTMVWDRDWANPDTVLRNCTIEMSCRLQTGVTLINCTVTALLWFYCEHIEGPFPAGVRLEGSTLRRGRGNPRYAVIFRGLPGAGGAEPETAAPPRAIRDIVIENNRIFGGFRIEGAENVQITGNRFLERGADISVRHNHALTAQDNRDADSRLIAFE